MNQPADSEAKTNADVAAPISGQETAVQADKRAPQPEADKQKSKSTLLGWAKDFGTRWRRGAIEKTPRVIVNNSSNVMGIIQIAAELFMFRSSGIELLDKKNPHPLLSSKPWAEKSIGEKALHHIYDPARNILDGVFKKGGLGNHPLQKEFYTQLPERLKAIPSKLAKVPEQLGKLPSRIVAFPENFVSGVKRLNDTSAATLRDRTNELGEVQKLTNKWSARATLSGIFAWSLVAVLPDKKDTQEETEKNTALAKNHPVLYVGKRVYQALNPLEWWNHKRQLGGLGAMLSGTFSFISGFRQIGGTEIGHQLYMKNPWQALGGAITATSGTILLLAVDNDSGYRNFGTMQLLRTLTLPNSIATRFKGIDLEKAKKLGAEVGIEVHQKLKEQGAKEYLTGSALLNGKNFFAASVAGAEKREDGTVVDHKAMRDEAKEKTSAARALKAEKHTSHPAGASKSEEDAEVAENASPTTKITQARDLAPAMPEREAEMASAAMPA